MHFLMQSILSVLNNIQKQSFIFLHPELHILQIIKNFSLILIFIIGGGGCDSMQPNLSVNIKWGQMYKYFIFSKYISHKKEKKVKNLTLDYGQN